MPEPFPVDRTRLGHDIEHIVFDVVDDLAAIQHRAAFKCMKNERKSILIVPTTPTSSSDTIILACRKPGVYS